MNKTEFSLDRFAGGALTEKVNVDMMKIINNIADLNTDPATKRKLTIELTFSPSKMRDIVSTSIVTKVKLADYTGVETRIMVDRDLNGNVVCSEYDGQIIGQLSLEDVELNKTNGNIQFLKEARND